MDHHSCASLMPIPKSKYQSIGEYAKTLIPQYASSDDYYRVVKPRRIAVFPTVDQ